jgi:hypothetical protein
MSDIDNKLPRDVFVVHSLGQPNPLWAKQGLDYYTLIF